MHRGGGLPGGDFFQGGEFPSAVDDGEAAEGGVPLGGGVFGIGGVLLQLGAGFCQFRSHVGFGGVMGQVFELHDVGVLHFRVVQEVGRHPQVGEAFVHFLFGEDDEEVGQAQVDKVEHLHGFLALEIVADRGLLVELVGKVLENRLPFAEVCHTAHQVCQVALVQAEYFRFVKTLLNV